MPSSPNNAQDQRRTREAESLREARQREAAPADFLASLKRRRDKCGAEEHEPGICLDRGPRAGREAVYDSSGQLYGSHIEEREAVPACFDRPDERPIDQRSAAQPQPDEGGSERSGQKQRGPERRAHRDKPRETPERPAQREGEAEELQERSQRATFATVSHVRVVRSFPNVFSISDMNTGPLGFGR